MLKLTPKLFLLVFVWTFSCSSGTVQDEAHKDYPSYYHSLHPMGVDKKLGKYTDLKNRINAKQRRFTIEYPTVDQAHKNGLVTLAKNYLYTTMCDSVFSHWYGTQWDFNGTTQEPRKGQIACGYFVTTTLKHAGFDINRVQLAQQAASKIITTMCGKGKTKVIGNSNEKALSKYIGNQKDGIFIVGLDNHVGFIQKKGSKQYFIHSSGLSPQQVVREKLLESKAIKKSDAYYVGNLLENKTNIIKWIKKEKIKLAT